MVHFTTARIPMRNAIHTPCTTDDFCEANLPGSDPQLRILLVDDDEALSRQMSRCLRWTGRYVVQTAKNCAQARRILRQFKPHFIFFDVDLPDADGGEMAKFLKQNPSFSDIPYAFVTGLVGRDEVQRQNGRIGDECFIAKPASLKDLLSAIDEKLARPGESAAPACRSECGRGTRLLSVPAA